MTESGAGRVSITRRVRFAAARRLHSDRLDATNNERLFGRDRGLHGRDFSLFVTVGGPLAAESGMILDLKELSQLLKSLIVARIDRSQLEDTGFLGGLPPTTENLTVTIWRTLETRLAAGTLIEVALWEGEDRRCRYRGE